MNYYILFRGKKKENKNKKKYIYIHGHEPRADTQTPEKEKEKTTPAVIKNCHVIRKLSDTSSGIKKNNFIKRIERCYTGHSTKCNTTVRQQTTICLICLHDTRCSTISCPMVFRVESCLWLHRGFFGPNPASGCVVDIQGRIMVTVLNAFSDSSFINPACAYAVFEISTHNPSRTSDCRGDPLEQIALVVATPKQEELSVI